jgi:hypothetical protein
MQVSIKRGITFDWMAAPGLRRTISQVSLQSLPKFTRKQKVAPEQHTMAQMPQNKYEVHVVTHGQAARNSYENPAQAWQPAQKPAFAAFEATPSETETRAPPSSSRGAHAYNISELGSSASRARGAGPVAAAQQQLTVGPAAPNAYTSKMDSRYFVAHPSPNVSSRPQQDGAQSEPLTLLNGKRGSLSPRPQGAIPGRPSQGGVRSVPLVHAGQAVNPVPRISLTREASPRPSNRGFGPMQNGGNLLVP